MRNVLIFLGVLLCSLVVLSVAFGQAVYGPPDETNATHAQGWTPPAGHVAVHPIVDCGGLDGTGMDLSNNNVTLVNPDVSNCARGIFVTGDGARIIADPNAAGYQQGMVEHNNSGVLFDLGASDGEVFGIGNGELFIRNNYRPVTIQSGSDILISDTDITHPGSFAWPVGHSRSIVGIKAIGYLTDFPAGEKSMHDITITDNDVSGFDEEGISNDPNGNAGADAMVRGTGTVASVNPANNTVTLSGANQAGMENAYLVFNSGGAKGRHLKITSINANTVTVADPEDYLSGVSAGNGVSVGGPFVGFDITDNNIDASGSFVGISWGGFVFESEMRDNLITGTASRNYPNHFNLRPNSRQAIRHSGLTDMPGTGQVASSAYNSVTGNVATGANMDMSWHHRGGGSLNGLPTYRANNTVSATGQIYEVPGDYTFLSTDPNAPAPPPDGDGDGVPDASDNCPSVSNAGQADQDGDGAGDACDNQDNRDNDGDSFENFEDACPDVAGVAPDGCPAAPVSVTREAENMVLASGATVTAGGDTVRMDANGERANWNDVGAGHDSVTIVGRHNGNGNSRVCVELRLNGAIVGTTRCYSQADSAFQERTWALPAPLTASDDLSFFSREVTSPEVFYFDRARAE